MTITRDPVEEKILRTLHAVAQTVTAETHPERAGGPRSASTPRRRSRRRKWTLIGGAVAVPILLAAGAYLQTGPEYVAPIPEDRIIVRGETGGDQYLLVRARTSACPRPGVELVVKEKNLIGSEWNTTGTDYGDVDDTGCYVHTRRYLADPTLANDGGQEVGDSFVWTWAVHPDVTTVRIVADGKETDLAVHTVDGAGYAVYEIPDRLEKYTAEFLIGDRVVPGSREEHRVPATS